ncbi:aldo/keto reductase [Croceicoccus naphthovorans]|uniref:Aldo/keto reductase n=1 Tax=Croceicoccus naphthovorans TaxID=1348774 RepID=A0A0G3XDQ3_9SPHN|nr:aldo/keto reductase [Croceicoccus naphthovorans]AKM09327.1 aldo/keto reductase [Croceicoccus naphthovorans]MBB3990237.1 aryl-alcohol dehydrogenase-like predicted oxidoreductase [Croceicoccus naphthovorans]
MIKRTLAGRAVNPIGLGCMNVTWAYGSPISREDAVSLFREALDEGYDHFDTANIYGGGVSEEILGEAIMDRRDDFLLASKMGIVVEGDRRGIDCSPDAIVASLDASLKRLKTDRIDLYYMHRLDPKVPIAESVGAMVRAMEAGKIGAYGVSEWSAAHIREAHGVHPMAAVQTEYSPWTRNVELGVLDTTRELGIALVAFSPVARGALANALGDPLILTGQDLRGNMPRFSAENWPCNMDLIRAFNALAAEARVTPAQLSLAWVLSRAPHLHAIPGTSNAAHMVENSGTNSLTIAPDVLERVGEIVNQATVSGHRYPESLRGFIDTEDF